MIQPNRRQILTGFLPSSKKSRTLTGSSLLVIAKIVRHGEVQPDLPHDEQKAEQDHGHLFPLKSFEKLIHIASLPYL